MRNEFKEVSIKGDHFLYPIPVIKGKKYLLKIDEGEIPLYQKAFLEGLIPSPDHDLSLWEKEGVHTDGKTVIYKPVLDKERQKVIRDLKDSL